MARPKKATLELSSVDDCTAAMARLLIAETELEKLVAVRDQKVAAASAEFEGDIDRYKSQKAELVTALQTYYMAHLPEMESDGKKHFDLPNGVIGRRMAPPKLALLNRSWTWASVLVRLREMFGTKFLRMRDPEVDKDLVKARLDEDQLRDVGLRLEQDETFYAEPARLPDVEAA